MDRHCLSILPSPSSFDENASVIHIIKYKNPLPPFIVAQPVAHELENIGRWVLPSRDLDTICDISKALLKSGSVTSMNPEHPCFQRAVSNSIGVFDCELRFASNGQQSVLTKAFTLTQRRLSLQAQSEILGQRMSDLR